MSGQQHRYNIPAGKDWGAFTVTFKCYPTLKSVSSMTFVHVEEFRFSDHKSAVDFVDSVRNGALDEAMFDDTIPDGTEKDRIERLYSASESLLENLEDACSTVNEGESGLLVQDSTCDLFDVSCFLTVFLGLCGWAGFDNEFSDVVYHPDFAW